MLQQFQINTNNTNVPISLVSPVAEKEKNNFRLYPINIRNANSRGIYFSRKRLICLIIAIIGFILVISATVGILLYLRSRIDLPTSPSKSHTSMITPSRSSSTAFSSPTLQSSTIQNVTLSADIDDPQCQLPVGNSCTSTTPNGTRLKGLGVYHHPCVGEGPGCDFLRKDCHLCWIRPDAPEKMDRPECPPCVSAFFKKLG
jgi:hypothetical protein